jgi:hypothetical protein
MFGLIIAGLIGPYHGINELKIIFELHQQGALNKNEFEEIKTKILKKL